MFSTHFSIQGLGSVADKERAKPISYDPEMLRSWLTRQGSTGVEQSWFERSLNNFARFWLALHQEQPFGTSVTILLLLLALLAPMLAPYNPEKLVMQDRLLPISRAHWLGTDEFGRDLFSRVLFGARVAVIVVAISVTISATLGTLLGLLAGFYGQTVDFIISRF